MHVISGVAGFDRFVCAAYGVLQVMPTSARNLLRALRPNRTGLGGRRPPQEEVRIQETDLEVPVVIVFWSPTLDTSWLRRVPHRKRLKISDVEPSTFWKVAIKNEKGGPIHDLPVLLQAQVRLCFSQAAPGKSSREPGADDTADGSESVATAATALIVIAHQKQSMVVN